MIIITLSFIFPHAADLLKKPGQLSCGMFHILNWSCFFVVLPESRLNMDSSALFASSFIFLVFRESEFLEPSDRMPPLQTVGESTARSLWSSVSRSHLRTIITSHLSSCNSLPPCLAYSFLVLPSPPPPPSLLMTSSTIFQNGSQTPLC